jgi:Zn-dependent peptidase ImmA (M78 family)
MPLSYQELVSIEEKAFNLLNSKKRQVTPPIDVEAVALQLGLQVIPYELSEISGALIIENNQGFIGYNPAHNDTRRRFTIAHEIGHYYLHCNGNESAVKKDQLFVDKDFIVKYRNANNYTFAELKQEQQANAFAAALLMPKELIEKELKKTENLSEIDLIGHLATLFNVSIPAMTFRLDNLNTYFYK